MTLLSLPYLSSVKQFIFLDAVSLSPSLKFWIPGYRLFRFIKLLGKDWVDGPGTELESATFFRSTLKNGGMFSLVSKNKLADVLAVVDTNAASISWICSSRRSEKIGKRLAKKQARIHRVLSNHIVDEFKKLISSQAI
jgi:hypothetical protein